MNLTNNYGRCYNKKLLKAPNMEVMKVRIRESEERGWHLSSEVGRFDNGYYGCVMHRK